MNREVDVIVVGGGVVGLSTALHLRLQGVERVAVLERHHIGSGQSGRAAGVARALVGDPRVCGWLLESAQFFCEFEGRFGVPLRANRVGYLLAAGPDQAGTVSSAIAACLEAGCAAELIDEAQARELQPGLAEGSDGTVYAWESEAVYVDAMSVTQALAKAAADLGVQIHQGCAVGEVRVGQGVEGVVTNLGELKAPKILIATSVWGRDQLLKLGTEVPVFPHRAEMAFFQTPLSGGHRVQRIISDGRSQVYLRPEGENQMFVGWREGDWIASVDDLTPENPDNYRQSSYFDSLDRMHSRLSATLPFMSEGFAHRSYACVYDYTPDGMPILDRSGEVEGLYFALGNSGGGFSLSPWVGRTMAEFIASGTRPPEIEILDLARFAEGRLISWSNVVPSK
jgi:glycine/D-amino acid oxidase-like deaminating enzyme